MAMRADFSSTMAWFTERSGERRNRRDWCPRGNNLVQHCKSGSPTDGRGLLTLGGGLLGRGSFGYLGLRRFGRGLLPLGGGLLGRGSFGYFGLRRFGRGLLTLGGGLLDRALLLNVAHVFTSFTWLAEKGLGHRLSLMPIMFRGS